MIPIAQMECCTMLGIDPKTLRNWLRHAGMQFVAHPTDARLKCLTQEQVQQLATSHARPLQMASDPSPALREQVTPLASSPEQALPVQENKISLVSAASSLSEETALRKAVCGLEAKVLALQEQLTQLTFELLRERTERYEQCLSALEAQFSQHATGSSNVAELGPPLRNGGPVPQPRLGPSSQLNSLHAPAFCHALNREPKVSMCSSVHRRGCFLSPLIRQSGLTGLPHSPLSALSAHWAVLPPTAKARRACGKPIAPSTVVPTGVTWGLPIA